MSLEEGPPPVFDGEDFAYWKIHMESYLEAIDTNLHTTVITGFPAMADKDMPTPTELTYDKWNAKARNILFRGLCKDVFNRVRTIKDAHKLWEEICALYEETKSEREEHRSLLSKQLTTSACFLIKMLTKCTLI